MRPGKSWKVTRQCQATAKTGVPLRATTDQGQRVTHAVLTSGAVLPGRGAVRPPTSGALALADVAPVLARTRPHLQVQMHPIADVAAVAVSQPRSHGTRRPGPVFGENNGVYEEWPYLDEAVLLKTRSRKICMTCHWFRHHAGVNCIPVLTRQLHQGLIAHGEHLTSRCQGWTDDMARQRSCAPEGV